MYEYRTGIVWNSLFSILNILILCECFLLYTLDKFSICIKFRNFLLNINFEYAVVAYKNKEKRKV